MYRLIKYNCGRETAVVFYGINASARTVIITSTKRSHVFEVIILFRELIPFCDKRTS